MDLNQILLVSVSLLGLLWTGGMSITGWLFSAVIKCKGDIQALQVEKYTHEEARDDRDKFLEQIKSLTIAIHALEVRLAESNSKADAINEHKLKLIQEMKNDQDSMILKIEDMQREISSIRPRSSTNRGGR